MLPVIIMKLLN